MADNRRSGVISADFNIIDTGAPVLSLDNFPADDPEDGTLLFFNADQSSFTSGKTVRNDADDADVTEAKEGDLFKYFVTGTKWVRQYREHTAGAGIAISEGKVISARTAYIQAIVDASDQWFEHANILHTNQFDVDTGARWHSYEQQDTTGYVIRVLPDDNDVGIFESIVSGSKIQLRTAAGAIVNTFTVEADPADPIDDIWLVYGAYDNVRSFDADTTYRFFFSHSRQHKIETDGVTTTGDGRHATPVKVKDEGIRDEHVASDLDTAEQGAIRDKIAAGEEYHTIVARMYEANAPRNQTGEVTLILDEDEVYDLDIENGSPSNLNIEGTKNDELINHFFSTLAVGTKVKISNRDDATWIGLVIGHTSADTTDATLSINFESGRVGTFTDSELIYIYFGYAPAGVKPDDSTLEIKDDGTIGVKAEGLDDTHLSASLTATTKADYRFKIGANAFTVGDSVPTTDLKDGDWHYYSADATSLSSHVDTDNAALTAVMAGDIVEYDSTNTRWVLRYEASFNIPSDLTSDEKRTIRGNIDARRISFVTSAPSSPLTDDVIIYRAAATGLVDHRDSAGVNSEINGSPGEVFQWNGSYWIQRMEFG